MPRPEILFWRTSKGAEVDLVIEASDLLLPVEVKSRGVVRVSPAPAFMDDYGTRVPAGVLVYGGRETYWLTDRVLAVPWNAVL